MRSMPVGMLLLLVLAGCGGSDDDDSGPVGPACPEDRVLLQGDLDSTAIDLDEASGDYSFNQLSAPKKLTAGIADGSIELTWASLVAEGETASASGKIVMPSALPHGGETLCAGSAAITPREDDYGFALRDLDDCNGGPALGSLEGCVSSMF